MTQSLTKPATYSAALDALRHSRGQASPQWLADLGDQAWARFTELGFPTARRGNEKWKYTNVAPIARAAFGYAWDLDPDEDPAAGRLRHFGLLDEAWVNLVFVDGRFSGSLSSRPETAGGVTVTSLAEAVSRDGEIVQRHLAEYAGFQDDGFTALNTAFLSDGAFVHVPRNHSSVPPVHLVFLTTNRELPRAVHPRTLIVVEENAALSVVETYAGPSNEQYFTNAVTEISVGDGSASNTIACRWKAPTPTTWASGECARAATVPFPPSLWHWATRWAATTSRSCWMGPAALALSAACTSPPRGSTWTT